MGRERRNNEGEKGARQRVRRRMRNEHTDLVRIKKNTRNNEE